MMFRILLTFLVCVYCVLGETPHHLCDEVGQLDCSKDYIPYETNEKVCGSDGVTYNNFCEYSQARCKTPATHIAHIGDCNTSTTTAPTQGMTTGGSPPNTGSTAPPATGSTPSQTAGSSPAVVTTAPMTIGNTGPTTIDPTLQVFCQSKDAITCPTNLDPLCGSDKNFYLNQCEFTKARCDKSGLTQQAIAFCTPGTRR